MEIGKWKFRSRPKINEHLHFQNNPEKRGIPVANRGHFEEVVSNFLAIFWELPFDTFLEESTPLYLSFRPHYMKINEPVF